MSIDDLILFGAGILAFVIFGGAIEIMSERLYWKWIERKHSRDKKNE
tara:strand:+ start:117 stop:257 length:141 start_codon:yes stop_codon:yes gene_type:complete